ncbi:MAG: DUF4358 domain-containing protein [Oscillospiraceae bacterium]
MKKILPVIIALATLLAFSGCQSEKADGPIAETTADTTATTAETTAETTATTAATTVATTVATTAKPAVTTAKPVVTTVKPVVTTAAPVTTVAPVTTTEAPKTGKTNAELAAIINGARSEDDNKYNVPLTEKNKQSEFIFQMLGVTEEQMENYAICVSMMNVKAYGVAIIKPAKDCDKAVKDGVDAFVSTQQKNFEHYLADQYEIAKNAKVEVLKDGTIVLVMCENSDAVYKSITDALK